MLERGKKHTFWNSKSWASENKIISVRRRRKVSSHVIDVFLFYRYWKWYCDEQKRNAAMLHISSFNHCAKRISWAERFGIMCKWTKNDNDNGTYHIIECVIYLIGSIWLDIDDINIDHIGAMGFNQAKLELGWVCFVYLFIFCFLSAWIVSSTLVYERNQSVPTNRKLM